MKTNILVLLGLVVWLSSCTEKRLFRYNETKIFPIEAELNESYKIVHGTITTNDLKKLFDIPEDGEVESFSISGVNLVVERLSSSEADWIDYAMYFNATGDLDTLVLKKSKDVSTLVGVKSFNLSSELNGRAVDNLECVIQYLLTGEPSSCGAFDIEFSMGIEGKDFTGNRQKFAGKVTGQLSIQVVYTVCESLPEGLFTDYPKCK